MKAVWNGEEFAKVRYYHDQPMEQSSVLQELQRHVIPNGLTGQVSRSRTAERVVAFYNKRGTYDQWIKEGKGAIKWTRLSCRMFAANAVRLQLHALARHKSES